MLSLYLGHNKEALAVFISRLLLSRASIRFRYYLGYISQMRAFRRSSGETLGSRYGIITVYTVACKVADVRTCLPLRCRQRTVRGVGVAHWCHRYPTVGDIGGQQP